MIVRPEREHVSLPLNTVALLAASAAQNRSATPYHLPEIPRGGVPPVVGVVVAFMAGHRADATNALVTPERDARRWSSICSSARTPPACGERRNPCLGRAAANIMLYQKAAQRDFTTRCPGFVFGERPGRQRGSFAIGQ